MERRIRTAEKETPCGNNLATPYQKSELIDRTLEIIMASWKNTTRKQYGTYLQQWSEHCIQRGTRALSPTIKDITVFLTELYDRGLGYSGINIARSALSNIITIDGVAAGEHPILVRLLRSF